ncbi:MAG: class I SAM-dependent methyltransferase [Planctomycetes bacterium]|nr:class I SAM-dependent methyltransferase [Planctomycetota bacterium]
MSDTTYEPVKSVGEMYPDAYFANRVGNDPRRQAQFQLEAALIRKYVESGPILDVGCSTGEFLQALAWPGERHGMEVSVHARRIAQERGVRFDRDIFNAADFFACVVFRGTIQHIDEPFRFIKQSNRAMRVGGHLFFLATPNLNCPVYRWTKRLPIIDPATNYYVPDDVNLPMALRNFGFEVLEIRYPYWNTPYCRPLRDHLLFLLNLFSRRYRPHAFWRNSMEVVARKARTI